MAFTDSRGRDWNRRPLDLWSDTLHPWMCGKHLLFTKLYIMIEVNALCTVRILPFKSLYSYAEIRVKCESQS